MSESSAHKPTIALRADQIMYQFIPEGKKRLIKSLMTEKKVFQCETLAEQIFLTMGVPSSSKLRKSYNLTFSQASRIFKVKSKSLVRDLYFKGMRRHEGNVKSPGRNPELTKEQEREVIEYIVMMQNLKTPVSPIELLAWVNLTFDKNLSQSWPNKFVERQSDSLFIVNAVPLEEERADITIEQLKEYERIAKERLPNYDARLVCNWDQTASESYRKGNKNVIVVGKNGKSPGNVYYKTTEPVGHISLMPVIFPDGDCIPPLIIITQATIDSDLEEFGLPNSDLGYVLSTTSGFTNADAHLDYVKTKVIPFFQQKRKQLGLNDTAKGLILQDGLSAYFDPQVQNLLEDHNIDTLEIPAHSSHITQPLHVNVFPHYKRSFKSYRSPPKHLTERSQRLYRVLYCIEQRIGKLQNQSAFKCAGFIYDRKTPTKLTFDLSIILKNERAPKDLLVAEDIAPQTKRVKRIKVRHHQTKKEKIKKPTKMTIIKEGLKLTIRRG